MRRIGHLTSILAASALALAVLAIGPGPARAATITVTGTGTAVANDGVCTLIEAITAANDDAASGAAAGECPAGSGADTIVLQAGATYTLTTDNNPGTFFGRNEAFRWTAETGLVSLGLLPGDTFSEARGVSADGAVVVGVSESALTSVRSG